MTTDDLRYPVGRFAQSADPDARRSSIAEIAALPARLRAAVAGLTDAQLDTPYRPEGWTLRQVAHHLADSHINGFMRLKLALTEETPTIKPYDENAFSTLGDMRLPAQISLDILDGLHARWVALYGAMTEAQFARAFVHPEHRRAITLDEHVQMYAWHSRHHVAHITELRRRQQW